jgi:DNA modification methylase
MIIYASGHGALHQGDALAVLRDFPPESVQCCITSPPYWCLRDYGVSGQIGLEDTPEEHVMRLLAVFREVRRVLKNDGTLWVNYGDAYSYAADKRNWKPHGKQASNTASLNVGARRDWRLPPKNLLGLPWRLAFALQDDGWILRSDIIWHKLNPMPESVKDRPTRAHEYLFLFAKNSRYYFDHEAIREPIAALSYDTPQPHPRSLTFARFVREPDRPGQKMKQHRPNRNPRPGIDTHGGNQGTGGIPQIPHDIPAIGKGNAKTFRGGGAYTGGNSFDNVSARERDSHGNVPNLTYTRNIRDVWSIPTFGYPEAHFATFPPALIEPCILAGSRPGDTVLDPFVGSGTTCMVARQKSRNWIGIELNPAYCALALKRIDVSRLRLTET